NGIETAVHLVRKVFENAFCTDQKLALEDMDECEFHLAAGEPLTAHPAVQDALLLLSIALDGLGFEREFPEISRWLLSPYWCGADRERAARARLELSLRKGGSYWRSPAAALRLAGAGFGDGELTEMANCGQQVRRAIKNTSPNPDFSAQFCTILEAWGWPGPLARGADVARNVNQFCVLVERLGRSNLDSGAKALTQLQHLCQGTRLELRGGPLSPVQVLSPEDAAGRRFDAAWIANVHDGNWPSHPLMNSFLPAGAAGRIPRSTAAGELDYCRRLTRELRALAPHVHFSWSRQTDDVPNGISPLLADLDPGARAATDSGAASSSSLHDLLAPRARTLSGYRDHPWLIAVPDVQGLPLQSEQGPTPAERIPGGAHMVSDQSACPLMAYFRHRLKARFEDQPTPFADAAYRGSLMHAAMQNLFSAQTDKPGQPAP
ncbi:MAG: hypothetical protein ACREO9_07675, partial [Lysobacterales bacterium]